MPTNEAVVRDYTGPCIDLIPRCRVVEVTRGGRVEAVAMPGVDTTHDEPSGRHVVTSTLPQQGDICPQNT